MNATDYEQAMHTLPAATNRATRRARTQAQARFERAQHRSRARIERALSAFSKESK